jgi:site-specific recombinase XerD
MIAQYMRGKKTFTATRDYNIFLIMLSTGIRLTELSEVRITDIEGRKLSIKNTKNLKQREVWLPKKVEEEINKYLKLRGELGHTYLFISIDNEPLKKRSIQNRFEVYRKELKINKRFSAHTLRHTFAKRAVLSGMSSFVLAELLGHSDLTIVKKYVNFWGNDIEEEATKYNSLRKLKI